MSTERWVSDKLLSILNFSDKFTAQYLTCLAEKSVSSDELIEKVRTTETIDVSRVEVVSFLSELWSKIPRAAPKVNVEQINRKKKEQEMIAMLEKNKRYKLIEESDDEEPSSVAASAPKKGKYSDPESGEDEDRKLQKDRKERDEFSERMKKKDKEKQRNVVATGKGIGYWNNYYLLLLVCLYHILNLTDFNIVF